MPIDENIGTKEQRRERKRKHNVKELFSTKRPRGSDKSSKARLDKKSAAAGISNSGTASAGLTVNSQSSVNGLLCGVDPMFPANPLKVEGLPASSLNHDARNKSTVDHGDHETKKKRRRLKKKQDGEAFFTIPCCLVLCFTTMVYTSGFITGLASDTSELSQKRQKNMSSDDEECSIQWTNGEPQGEAAYVIESAEGMFSGDICTRNASIVRADDSDI